MKVSRASCMACIVASVISSVVAAPPRVVLQHDKEDRSLTMSVDGREAVTYQYAERFALPHYWPLRSPSGKLLTVQQGEPFPHHRSVWIADKIQVADMAPVDFYHTWTNRRDENDPHSGFRNFIRHREFTHLATNDRSGEATARLEWIVNESTPVLEEMRTVRMMSLGDGEYLLDLAWTLRPVDKDVKFVSDWVHYAWPYVRMHPQFSGDAGGTITSDTGEKGQQQTDGKRARWIDYSNAVDGTTEGLAIFVSPGSEPPKWLTRGYGTFGPRRPDATSGTNFTLEVGDDLGGRVGLYVHKGDVVAGRVAERYAQFIEGKL